jgi:PAS domain S-box-containing protein
MKTEVERLRELLAINQSIAAVGDYDAALRLVVEKARAFTGASACALLLSESGAKARIVASTGIAEETIREFEHALDERIADALRERLELGPEDTIFAVPMIARGSLPGILAVVRAHEPERSGEAARLDQEDEYMLSALADQAAIALARSAQVRELEAAIGEAERERHERERVFDELSRERAWLRAVIEQLPVAVFLVEGPAGERVTMNPRAEELFGLHHVAERGIGQYVRQLCRPDGTPLPEDQAPSVATMRGEPMTRELAIRRADGTLVPVRAHAAPIRGAHAEIAGAVVVYEDMTIVRGLERMREEWTSVVAHDLRQPLNAIATHTELIARQNDILRTRIEQDARHILSRTGRLNRMVGDLLDVSLIEARHLSLARSANAVRPLLAQIVERCTGLTEGHRVDVLVDDEVPDVDVDAGRIEQVVANLLSNAAKYGAPEAPIQLRAEPRADEVEITVRNQGPRVEAATLAALFHRFQRGEGGGAQTRGAGLGLYISKGIVEAHGGHIWAESTPGATTFHFTLPASPDARATPAR